MLNKSALVFMAALGAASIASPAFAQSREHEGGVLPNYYDATGQQTWGSWSPPAAAAPAHAQSRIGRIAVRRRSPEQVAVGRSHLYLRGSSRASGGSRFKQSQTDGRRQSRL